jgi:hypothetical protein
MRRKRRNRKERRRKERRKVGVESNGNLYLSGRINTYGTSHGIGGESIVFHPKSRPLHTLSKFLII